MLLSLSIWVWVLEFIGRERIEFYKLLFDLLMDVWYINMCVLVMCLLYRIKSEIFFVYIVGLVLNKEYIESFLWLLWLWFLCVYGSIKWCVCSCGMCVWCVVWYIYLWVDRSRGGGVRSYVLLFFVLFRWDRVFFWICGYISSW